MNNATQDLVICAYHLLGDVEDCRNNCDVVSNLHLQSLADLLGVQPSIDEWLDDDGEQSPHVPNKLSNWLERRPSKDELVGQGILKTQVQQVSEHLARKSITSQRSSAQSKRPVKTPTPSQLPPMTLFKHS